MEGRPATVGWPRHADGCPSQSKGPGRQGEGPPQSSPPSSKPGAPSRRRGRDRFTLSPGCASGPCAGRPPAPRRQPRAQSHADAARFRPPAPAGPAIRQELAAAEAGASVSALSPARATGPGAGLPATVGAAESSRKRERPDGPRPETRRHYRDGRPAGTAAGCPSCAAREGRTSRPTARVTTSPHATRCAAAAGGRWSTSRPPVGPPPGCRQLAGRPERRMSSRHSAAGCAGRGAGCPRSVCRRRKVSAQPGQARVATGGRPPRRSRAWRAGDGF